MATEIIQQTETSRLYQKQGEYFVSQQAGGVFRRVKINETVLKIIQSPGHNLDDNASWLLDISKAAGDRTYYQTTIK